MADPAVIREAFWSWGKVSNSSREKVELKLGGILRIVGSCPTELVSISNFHIVKKSISSLPCTAAKATAVSRIGSVPQLDQKAYQKAFCLRKGCYQQATVFTIVYTQPNINMGHRKECSPKAYKAKGH